MQRTDFNANRTNSPPTPAEIAADKAFRATPDGQRFFAGITDPAQFAAVYNPSRQVPNPVPQGTVQAAAMPKNKVIDALGKWAMEADAAANDKAHNAIIDARSTVEADSTDPISAADLAPFIQALGAAGMDVSAEASQMMAVPDPNWQPTVTITLASMVFGTDCAVELTDVPLMLA